MNKSQLRNDLETALSELHDLLSAVPEENINTAPHPGSWTPGQLGYHLALVNGGFVRLVYGPVQETGRPWDAAVEKIRATLTDLSAKRQAPEAVVPPTKDYDKERLLASLAKIRQDLLTAVDALNLEPTCTGYELPAVGHLTRWEAFHFVLYHTRRHNRQLRNMLEVNKEKRAEPSS